MTLLYYFFARHSHESCLIPSPTGSEWHCLISLSGTPISHVSSPHQQGVSDTALFLCQAVLAVMSHHTTNSMWVTLLYHFFARLINHVSSHNQQGVSTLLYFFAHHLTILGPWPTDCKPCEVFYKAVSSLILLPTVGEWHAIFPSHFSYYNKQEVSHNHIHVFSDLYYHTMTHRKCVIRLYLLITLHLIA